MSEARYDAAALRGFAEALFAAAGLEADKAAAVAKYLVEADLMGHTTHGLALASWYLQSIADGVMLKAGAPDVLSDKGAAITWNGRRLPGAWLTAQAVALGAERARRFGAATVVVGNSHHIARWRALDPLKRLAAYLADATDQGLMVSISSSSPSGAQVAPFGGLKGVYTPNPVAHGIPTPGEPILIDISASITTVNMSQRLTREGRKLDHGWLMDKAGHPSNDPAVLADGGTLLPTGGLDHGQKGYGLALHVEAVTQGLAGYGRADAPKGTNAALTVQVYDPEAFGGRDAFLRQTGWLADACHANPPRPGVSAVRLPGEAAQRRRREALASGLVLYPGIMDGLAEAAQGLAVAVPRAL